MRFITLVRIAAALALACSPVLPAAPAVAAVVQQAPPEGPPVPAAELAAWQAYRAADQALSSNGYDGLRPFLAKLEQALDEAPASYPAVERHGDVWIVRAWDDAEARILIDATKAKLAGSTDPEPRFAARRNVYIMAAMFLTSAAVEERRWDDAIRFADQGLALQPDQPNLINEKIAACFGRHDIVGGMALADAALTSTAPLMLSRRGAFHRRRGFGLVELGRLDEAEAAYRESLKYDPDHPSVPGELAYIAGLRGGAAPSQGYMRAPASGSNVPIDPAPGSPRP